MKTETNELTLQYSWETKFNLSEELFISWLSSYKWIIQKITNKMVEKLINEMLNNKTTPEYVNGYKEAIKQFNYLIK